METAANQQENTSEPQIKAAAAAGAAFIPAASCFYNLPGYEFRPNIKGRGYHRNPVVDAKKVRNREEVVRSKNVVAVYFCHKMHAWHCISSSNTAGTA